MALPWVQFRAYLPVITEDTAQALQRVRTPRHIGTERKECPQNLQYVSYETLVTIQQSGHGDYNSTIDRIFTAVLGQTPAEMGATGREVMGFINMVSREMERIARLFDEIKPTPTAEEQRAGVETLQFGAFGIADFYALRMGITNHDEAFKTPWARIYKCLKMDYEKQQFEKRLRTIYQNKNKKR